MYRNYNSYPTAPFQQMTQRCKDHMKLHFSPTSTTAAALVWPVAAFIFASFVEKVKWGKNYNYGTCFSLCSPEYFLKSCGGLSILCVHAQLPTSYQQPYQWSNFQQPNDDSITQLTKNGHNYTILFLRMIHMYER